MKTKPSSAGFIAYNLRPAKQTERRLLIDFLKCVHEAGQAMSECRYVGMGGTMFYDFHLMHRFLGISSMVSLERDPDTYPRSRFNSPYDFIKVKNDTVANFLASDKDQSVTIYWLDYDDGIGAEIAADITSLGTRLKTGGSAFVTVCAHPPGILDKQNAELRLEYFQDQLGDLAVGLNLENMENAAFPDTIHSILMTAFTNAFAARTDGVFQPLFQVQYKDSVDMVTVGGCFSSKAGARESARKVKADLPFLSAAHLYKIARLELTARERLLFDTAVTTTTEECEQEKSLRGIGFRKKHFDAYRDLIRFLPRYHESII